MVVMDGMWLRFIGVGLEVYEALGNVLTIEGFERVEPSFCPGHMA